MKKCLFVLLASLLAISAQADETPKPACQLHGDLGERFDPEKKIDTSCLSEQLMVDAAVKGLTPQPIKKYCSDNADRGNADGTISEIGYGCRGLVRYQDANGKLSEAIFEEWFINPTGSRFRGIKVRGEDGLYRVFWQDPVDKVNPEIGSEIVVTSNNFRQSEMTITFSGKDNFYPRFDIHYDYKSKDLLATHGLYEYGPDKLNLLKYEPVLSRDKKSLERKDNGDFVIDLDKEIQALAYISISE